MDRGEKVAYYYSELGRKEANPQDHTRPIDQIDHNQTNEMNSIENNNQVKPNEHEAQYSSQNQQQLQTNQTQFNHNTNQDDASKQIHQQNKLVNSLVNQISSSNKATIVTTSQPQYLITNSNSQQLTNLTPQQQQHLAHQYNQSTFQNKLLSNYHINSNLQLYHTGLANNSVNQQQFHCQQQASSIEHQQTQNQNLRPSVLTVHQAQQIADQEQQRRQLVALNLKQSTGAPPQGGSLSPSELAKLRRKSEPVMLGLTSEIPLDNLNLDFETMLMNDGQTMMSNINPHQNVNGEGNKVMKGIVNHNPHANNNLSMADRASGKLVNNGSSSNSDYEQSAQITHQHSHSANSKDGIYAGHNRSQDDMNIYEDIDNATLANLQANLHLGYPGNFYGDTMSLHSENWKKKNAKRFLSSSFTRWFSTRKKTSINSHSSDMEDNPYIGSRLTRKPRHIIMPVISDERLKTYPTDKYRRRRIVESIVESENSYLNSLHRLIHEYKKPLEEANPSILSTNKIDVIFFNLEKISQLHTIFSLKLDEFVQNWDEKERIGDVFASSFSGPLVLETYSNFINNFTNAMETARRASKSKAFAQFLHDKSISSPDRLSLFGSMVKPVQRFPQFILFLNELLKHTPRDHPDRMSLQTALTELESLADKLNERKRDAERHFAVKQLLKDYLNDSNSHSQRTLLRQDDICLLDMNPNSNMVLKSKSRKLYLLNDMLICVSIPSNRLKFAVSLCDIDVVEDITPAASNLLAHSNALRNVKDNAITPLSPHNYSIERMECDRQSLVHDLDLMTRISAMVASLRFQYNGLPLTLPDQICMGIREEIRIKEFQITMIDRSCLQLRIRAKNHKETVCVQFKNPEPKRDWLIDMRLTKLALDTNNNPGWKNVNDNPALPYQASLNAFGHNRVPLFVKSLAVFGTSKQSQLTCALHYYFRQTPFLGENPAGVLWICNVNREASSLGALATNGAELSLIHSYELSDSHVTCLESVGSTLWIGLRQGRIIVIDANSPGEWVQFNSLDVHYEVTCIRYFGHFVYVGLISGVVAIYDAVNFGQPLLISLTESPVTCLLPINERIFACSHKKVWIIKGTDVVENFPMQSESDEIITTLEEEPRPNLLAHCGSGLWVSLIDSPVVKLYHAETLKHMRDINIGDSIRKILTDTTEEFKITVTSMLATRGLLWIGTNVGIVATLMLPRLQGVPVASGGIDIALHRFLGPVNLLLNLSSGADCVPQLPINARNSQVNPSRHANIIEKNEEMQIYGQYADLMNVNDYISARSSKPGSADVASPNNWDFPMNISSMNVSDDSTSTASSGAMYQQQDGGGLIRVHRQSGQPPSKTNSEGPIQQQQSTMSQPAIVKQQSLESNNLQQVSYKPADTNHIYECTTSLYNQQQQNQGGISIVPQDSTQITQTQANYETHQAPGSAKIYDRPQLQQHLMQARAQINSNSKNPYNQATYGLVGKNPTFLNNKTALVLAGGNG